jgi:hypothetical protein
LPPTEDEADMGKYLDIVRRAEGPGSSSQSESYDINDQNDKRGGFGRLSRFCRSFQELERRCPLYVEAADWQQATEDGRKFLASWGEQAETLGWTVRELFGLHAMPECPPVSYRRLSRYDETGLIWFLQGRAVVALMETEAAILGHSGAIVTYRKRNKPALGPLSDSRTICGG